MANLNNVQLMGNLTRDPELRYTPSGTAVVRFGIAINRIWNDADGNQKKDVCFVDISMFGRRAEVINEYFVKGNPIFVEGRLDFQQWETPEGQKRQALKVIAENFQFIGGKAGNRKEENHVDANKVMDNGRIPCSNQLAGAEITQE